MYIYVFVYNSYNSMWVVINNYNIMYTNYISNKSIPILLQYLFSCNFCLSIISKKKKKKLFQFEIKSLQLI